MKKSSSILLGFIACFAMVIAVSAAGYKTLSYKKYERITVDSMGSNFTTSIYVASVSGVPTVKTQVGRKMFGLMWYDSGSVTQAFASGGYKSTTPWTANGTWATRATWTNITSDTSVKAAFSLY